MTPDRKLHRLTDSISIVVDEDFQQKLDFLASEQVEVRCFDVFRDRFEGEPYKVNEWGWLNAIGELCLVHKKHPDVGKLQFITPIGFHNAVNAFCDCMGFKPSRGDD